MRKTNSRGSPVVEAARTMSRSSSWTTSKTPSASSSCSVRPVMRLTDPLTYRQPPRPKTMTRSVDELTRLRKCAVCRWAVRMSAQPSSSDSKRLPTPRMICRLIKLPMLRSSAFAIVRAAFSDTFDVSAARTRSRRSGSAGSRSPAVICIRPSGS